MVTPLESLKAKYMKDPDIIPPEGKDKEELAVELAQQQIRQKQNNERAFELLTKAGSGEIADPGGGSKEGGDAAMYRLTEFVNKPIEKDNKSESMWGEPTKKHLSIMNRPFNVLDKEDADKIELDSPPNNIDAELKQLEPMQELLENSELRDKIALQDEKLMEPFRRYLRDNDLKVDSERLSEINKDLSTIVHKFKFFYNRPRPHQVSDIEEFENVAGKSPSYPSGHSTNSTVIAELLADEFPEHADNLRQIGREIGLNRVIAGLHFPTDHIAGLKLAEQIIPLLIDKKITKSDEFMTELFKYMAHREELLKDMTQIGTQDILDGVRIKKADDDKNFDFTTGLRGEVAGVGETESEKLKEEREKAEADHIKNVNRVSAYKEAIEKIFNYMDKSRLTRGKGLTFKFSRNAADELIEEAVESFDPEEGYDPPTLDQINEKLSENKQDLMSEQDYKIIQHLTTEAPIDFKQILTGESDDILTEMAESIRDTFEASTITSPNEKIEGIKPTLDPVHKARFEAFRDKLREGRTGAEKDEQRDTVDKNLNKLLNRLTSEFTETKPASNELAIPKAQQDQILDRFESLVEKDDPAPSKLESKFIQAIGDIRFPDKPAEESVPEKVEEEEPLPTTSRNPDGSAIDINDFYMYEKNGTLKKPKGTKYRGKDQTDIFPENFKKLIEHSGEGSVVGKAEDYAQNLINTLTQIHQDNKDEDGNLKISSNDFNTQIYDAIKNTIHSENKDFEGLRQELFKTEEEKAVSNRTEQKLKGFNSIEELTDFRKTNADIYLSNKINELETQQVKLKEKLIDVENLNELETQRDELKEKLTENKDVGEHKKILNKNKEYKDLEEQIETLGSQNNRILESNKKYQDLESQISTLDSQQDTIITEKSGAYKKTPVGDTPEYRETAIRELTRKLNTEKTLSTFHSLPTEWRRYSQEAGNRGYNNIKNFIIDSHVSDEERQKLLNEIIAGTISNEQIARAVVENQVSKLPADQTLEKLNDLANPELINDPKRGLRAFLEGKNPEVVTKNILIQAGYSEEDATKAAEKITSLSDIDKLEASNKLYDSREVLNIRDKNIQNYLRRALQDNPNTRLNDYAELTKLIRQDLGLDETKAKVKAGEAKGYSGAFHDIMIRPGINASEISDGGEDNKGNKLADHSAYIDRAKKAFEVYNTNPDDLSPDQQEIIDKSEEFAEYFNVDLEDIQKLATQKWQKEGMTLFKNKVLPETLDRHINHELIKEDDLTLEIPKPFDSPFYKDNDGDLQYNPDHPNAKANPERYENEYNKYTDWRSKQQEGATSYTDYKESDPDNVFGIDYLNRLGFGSKVGGPDEKEDVLISVEEAVRYGIFDKDDTYTNYNPEDLNTEEFKEKLNELNLKNWELTRGLADRAKKFEGYNTETGDPFTKDEKEAFRKETGTSEDPEMTDEELKQRVTETGSIIDEGEGGEAQEETIGEEEGDSAEEYNPTSTEKSRATRIATLINNHKENPTEKTNKDLDNALTTYLTNVETGDHNLDYLNERLSDVTEHKVEGTDTTDLVNKLVPPTEEDDQINFVRDGASSSDESFKITNDSLKPSMSDEERLIHDYNGIHTSIASEIMQLRQDYADALKNKKGGLSQRNAKKVDEFTDHLLNEVKDYQSKYETLGKADRYFNAPDNARVRNIKAVLSETSKYLTEDSTQDPKQALADALQKRVLQINVGDVDEQGYKKGESKEEEETSEPESESKEEEAERIAAAKAQAAKEAEETEQRVFDEAQRDTKEQLGAQDTAAETQEDTTGEAETPVGGEEAETPVGEPTIIDAFREGADELQHIVVDMGDGTIVAFAQNPGFKNEDGSSKYTPYNGLVNTDDETGAHVNSHYFFGRRQNDPLRGYGHQSLKDIADSLEDGTLNIPTNLDNDSIRKSPRQDKVSGEIIPINERLEGLGIPISNMQKTSYDESIPKKDYLNLFKGKPQIQQIFGANESAKDAFQEVNIYRDAFFHPEFGHLDGEYNMEGIFNLYDMQAPESKITKDKNIIIKNPDKVESKQLDLFSEDEDFSARSDLLDEDPVRDDEVTDDKTEEEVTGFSDYLDELLPLVPESNQAWMQDVLTNEDLSQRIEAIYDDEVSGDNREVYPIQDWLKNNILNRKSPHDVTGWVIPKVQKIKPPESPKEPPAGEGGEGQTPTGGAPEVSPEGDQPSFSPEEAQAAADSVSKEINDLPPLFKYDPKTREHTKTSLANNRTMSQRYRRLTRMHDLDSHPEILNRLSRAAKNKFLTEINGIKKTLSDVDEDGNLIPNKLLKKLMAEHDQYDKENYYDKNNPDNQHGKDIQAALEQSMQNEINHDKTIKDMHSQGADHEVFSGDTHNRAMQLTQWTPAEENAFRQNMDEKYGAGEWSKTKEAEERKAQGLPPGPPRERKVKDKQGVEKFLGYYLWHASSRHWVTDEYAKLHPDVGRGVGAGNVITNMAGMESPSGGMAYVPHDQKAKERGLAGIVTKDGLQLTNTKGDKDEFNNRTLEAFDNVTGDADLDRYNNTLSSMVESHGNNIAQGQGGTARGFQDSTVSGYKGSSRLQNYSAAMSAAGGFKGALGRFVATISPGTAVNPRYIPTGGGGTSSEE